jgi:hypothetical protein
MQGKCRSCGLTKDVFGVQTLPRMTPSVLVGQQAQAQLSYFAFALCNDCVEEALLWACREARKATSLVRLAEVSPGGQP